MPGSDKPQWWWRFGGFKTIGLSALGVLLVLNLAFPYANRANNAPSSSSSSSSSFTRVRRDFTDDSGDYDVVNEMGIVTYPNYTWKYEEEEDSRRYSYSTPSTPVEAYTTSFHAQSRKNWENDPNGPFYYKGKYHLFMQYNPYGWSWGNMHWYHVISEDLLHWEHLPIALKPDEEYDCGGIFSGSATIVNDVPILTYSVECNEVMVNAIPSNLSDPYLVHWEKPSYNPIITKPTLSRPPTIYSKDFRDPTEGYLGKSDGLWRMVIGCEKGLCLYKSKDFQDWVLTGILWPSTHGFYECPDIFPIPGTDKWLLKGSAQNQEWWILGTYTEVPGLHNVDRFTSLTGDILEENRRLDMGYFYASKTFFDPKIKMRVLFGWIPYHCPGTDWSGIQSLPRVIAMDPHRDNEIITPPYPSIAGLRDREPLVKITNQPFNDERLMSFGALGSELDIEATLLVKRRSKSAGPFVRFKFRLFVDPDDPNSHFDVPFRISPDSGFVFTEPFPMYETDNHQLRVRIIVDRSVVETFVQGGRRAFSLGYCAPNHQKLDRMGVQIVGPELSVEVFIKDLVIHKLHASKRR